MVQRDVSTFTKGLGSVPAILLSVLLVLLCGVGGFFVSSGFQNNTYQLLINTATTIATFLMVSIIRSTQNRDGLALQAKLNSQEKRLPTWLRREASRTSTSTGSPSSSTSRTGH